MKKNVFLICFLLLFMTCCEDCNNPVGPDPPEVKYIDVEVKYQRIDDNLSCPRLWFDSRYVFLNGIGGPKEMPEIGKDLFLLRVSGVKAYPKDYSGGDSYEILMIDNAFYSFSSENDCAKRAHIVWLNGYLMDKVRKRGTGEYLLVWFDYDGVPHQK